MSWVRLLNFDALVFLPARRCDQNPVESPHANASTVPGAHTAAPTALVLGSHSFADHELDRSQLFKTVNLCYT